MTEPTKTSTGTMQELKILTRSFILSLLSVTTGAVLIMFIPLIDVLWMRYILFVFLGFVALASGFAGFSCFCIGVIRWAVLGVNHTQIAKMEGNRQKSTELLQSINDRLLFSDAAKRIAYRQRERDALRTAIQEDIAKGELDAALALVKEMSHLYGYHEEAEFFREQIQAARAAEMDTKVANAINELDQILTRCLWEQAAVVAAKIERQFPDSPRVVNLAQRVKDAKDCHKHSLENQFLQAAERDDVDLAMELLKELDKYLTETEAAPFRETARGVIGRKRDNLGVQFKLAVQDKEWAGAIRVGEQIVKEFPNTKMADEVRGMLDALHARTQGNPYPTQV